MLQEVVLYVRPALAHCHILRVQLGHLEESRTPERLSILPVSSLDPIGNSLSTGPPSTASRLRDVKFAEGGMREQARRSARPLSLAPRG